jgi:hypothetical protein
MAFGDSMIDRVLKHAPARAHRAKRSVIRDLVADDAGAVYAFGIGLGLVLIGVAWNVSSLGAAAVWRERATDVADAAAFDAAVWHARGMNLLVMSNLLMALFMALFTFWRMIVTVLTGLAYLCNWPLFPPCAFVQSLADQATRLDDRVARNVSVLQRSLASTERAIASLAPVLAMARTPTTLLGRYPEASAVQTFSQALLPSKIPQGTALGNTATAALGNTATAALGNTATAALGNTATAAQNLLAGSALRALEQRLGLGVSLPVQADAFDVLCSRGVEAQKWITRRFLPFDIDRFGPWWQAMTGGDSGFFCLNDAFPPELRQAVRAGLIVTCAVSEHPATCLARRLARFRPTQPAGSAGAGGISTAKVWDAFKNGSPLASVLAVAELPRPALEANDRGLVMPDAPGHNSLRALPYIGQVAAQAEYYFDCTGKWSECRDDAAWRLWYRARLRPLRTDFTTAAPGLPPDWVAALQDVARRYGGAAWQLATATEALDQRAPPEPAFRIAR